MKKIDWRSWMPRIITIFFGIATAQLFFLYFIQKSEEGIEISPQGTPAPIGQERPLSSNYDMIVGRNLFSETQEIPDPLKDESLPNQEGPDNAPVPTQLPLSLAGTLVHSNPEKSLAAIEIKSKNQVLTFTVGSTVSDSNQPYAKVMEIHRYQVIFRNLQNGRLEYLEMKLEGKLSFGAAAPPSGSPEGEFRQEGEHSFALQRTDLDKYIRDLPNVLMQCSSRPVNDPSSGEMSGFKILGCKSDSVFSKLGIQPNDIIEGANGVKVDSPAKAMDLFQALKNSSNVTIDINRNGEKIQMKYNIN